MISTTIIFTFTSRADYRSPIYIKIYKFALRRNSVIYIFSALPPTTHSLPTHPVMVTMDFNSDSSDGGVEITSYEKPFDQRTPIGLSTDSGGGGGGGADGDTDDDDVIVQRYSSTTSITAATSSYIPAAYRTEDTCKKKLVSKWMRYEMWIWII